MRHQYQTKIIGLLFLIGGICFLGEQLNFWDFTIFFSGWWTIFLILPALFSMLDSGVHLGNFILLVTGGYLLLYANDWINFRLTWGSIVALICILAGLRMIIGSRSTRGKQREDTSHTSNIHSNVAFGSRRFKGTGFINSMDIQCMCGSQYIDLSEADVRNMEYLNLNCVCGSIDLVVPADMNYVLKKDNVFASCYVQDEPVGKYDLYVDVSCVLGQINLRKKHVENVKDAEFKEK